MATFGSPSVPAGSSAQLRLPAAAHLAGSAEPASGFGLTLWSDGEGQHLKPAVAGAFNTVAINLPK